MHRIGNYNYVATIERKGAVNVRTYKNAYASSYL